MSVGRTIRIVTDSTADIPDDMRARFQLEVVPLKVLFGEEAFLDRVTIQSDAFYTRLVASPTLPTTSQPSPAEFVDVYNKLVMETPGATIISIHLASVLSGTYQSAVLATQLLEQEADITVVDSRSASYGIGMLAIAAARMAEEGADKQAILDELQRLRNDLRLYFLVDTLEYLQKGGRIGKAAALLGSILNIKPILTVDQEGHVSPVDKVRGQKKAMLRIVELLKADFGADPVRITLVYSQNRSNADILCALLQAEFNVQATDFTPLGAVIGTHVGPGAAGIFMHRV